MTQWLVGQSLLVGPGLQQVTDEWRRWIAENVLLRVDPHAIEGAMDDWPALTRWTAEYLKQRLGDRVVEVQANRNSDANYEQNQFNLKKEMPFGAYVDLVEAAGPTNDYYITANNSGKNRENL